MGSLAAEGTLEGDPLARPPPFGELRRDRLQLAEHAELSRLQQFDSTQHGLGVRDVLPGTC